MCKPSPRPPLNTPSPHLSQNVLQFETQLTTKPILSKTPSPAVDSEGNVVAAVPTAFVYGLQKPDAPGASWASARWTAADAANSAENPVTNDPVAVDLVLDNSDNTYLVVDDRNLLLSLDGYAFSWDSSGAPTAWAGAGMLKLQSGMRLFQLYHTSTLVGTVTSMGGQGATRLFVPVNSGFSQRGVAIASTDSSCSMSLADGCTTVNPPGGDLNVGNKFCCLQSPAIDADKAGTVVGAAYIDKLGMVALLAHSLGKKGPAVALYNEAGAATWVSPVQFVAHVNQPPPTVDPFTKNVYWVGVLQTAESTNNRLYCVAGATGAACPGFGTAGNGVALNTLAAYGSIAGCVQFFFCVC